MKPVFLNMENLDLEELKAILKTRKRKCYVVNEQIVEHEL